MNLKRTVATVSLGLLLLGSASCASTAKKAITDKTGVSVDKGGGIGATDHNGNGVILGGNGKVPSGWPAELKLPSGAKITLSSNDHQGTLLYVGLTTSGTGAAAQRFFKDELEAVGYKTEVAGGGTGNATGLVRYTKGNHGVVVTVLTPDGTMNGGTGLAVAYTTDPTTTTTAPRPSTESPVSTDSTVSTDAGS